MSALRELCADSESLGSPTDRQAAGRAGWVVDEDGWLRRARHKGDPDISPSNGNSHLGFTLDGKVFAVAAELALEYDRRARGE